MDVKFSCPCCGQHLLVDASGAGSVIVCPSCGVGVTVPKRAPVGVGQEMGVKEMNPVQRQVVMIGAAIMLVMGLVPPWVLVKHTIVVAAGGAAAEVQTREPAGYSDLWHPVNAPADSNPRGYVEPGVRYSVELDWSRLLAQWAGVAVVTGAAALYFKGSNKKSLGDALSG